MGWRCIFINELVAEILTLLAAPAVALNSAPPGIVPLDDMVWALDGPDVLVVALLAALIYRAPRIAWVG